MNKRQAKAAAYARVASVIGSALSGGWGVLDGYGEDRPKVEAALNELMVEFDRRGADAPPLDFTLLNAVGPEE